MLHKLTAGEWVIVGALVVIIGTLQQITLTMALGGLVAGVGLTYGRPPRH